MITTTASEKQIDVKAAAWTIGVHALLLTILALIYFIHNPIAKADLTEQLMEVNLGTSDNGSGDDQPMDVNDPAAMSASGLNNARPSTASSEMLTNDEEDAPVVNNPTNTRTVNQHNTTAVNRSRNNQQTPNNNTGRQRGRYEYSGATGPGGNSATENRPGTGEGNTTGNGDRGVPGGTPGASNYIGHNLGGREISPRSFSAEFREGGTVVIRVTVNREGQIVNKTVVSASSAELKQIALQKLSQAKFSKNPNAAPEQIGTVTIKFKAR